jgi:hypothetical protein
MKTQKEQCPQQTRQQQQKKRARGPKQHIPGRHVDAGISLLAAAIEAAFVKHRVLEERRGEERGEKGKGEGREREKKGEVR